MERSESTWPWGGTHSKLLKNISSISAVVCWPVWAITPATFQLLLYTLGKNMRVIGLNESACYNIAYRHKTALFTIIIIIISKCYMKGVSINSQYDKQLSSKCMKMSPSIKVQKIRLKITMLNLSEDQKQKYPAHNYSAVECCAGPCEETPCFRPKRLLSLWQLQKSPLPHINLTTRKNLP